MRFVLCGDFWFLRFLQPVRYAKNRNKNTVRFQRIGWKSRTVCVCVLVGKEPVRGSPTKSKEWPVSRTRRSGRFRVEIRPRNFQENDGKAGNLNTVRCLLQSRSVLLRSVVHARPKGMVPYGGKNKHVRFSGMWETVVGSKIPYGICTRSPVRWFVNNCTGYMDMWKCDACWKPVRYCMQGEVPTGWVNNWKYRTVYRALKKYPVRY